LDAGVAGWPVTFPTPPRDTALEGTPLGALAFTNTPIVLASTALTNQTALLMVVSCTIGPKARVRVAVGGKERKIVLSKTIVISD
jgi:hypothetical protein